MIDFDDFEGTKVSLEDDGGEGDAFPWTESPVPAEHQIRGLGYVIVTVALAMVPVVCITSRCVYHTSNPLSQIERA